MNIRSFLILERRRLLRNIQSVNDQLKLLPPSTIQFERNNPYWKWRQVPLEKERPSVRLPKSERKLAEAYALRRYLTERRDGMTDQVRLIDRFLSEYRDLVRYPDALNERCPDYHDLLAPYFAEQDAARQAWLDAVPAGSAGHPENLIHPTKSGILVRSKSEVLIADGLFDHGRVFRYEAPLTLGKITIHPDFTVQDNDPGQFILWEHFGMMESESYAQTANMKIAALQAAGFTPGKNLIITYESRDSPLDVNYVELLIGYFFSEST